MLLHHLSSTSYIKAKRLKMNYAGQRKHQEINNLEREVICSKT
jgi:hypothetical protein